MRNEMKSAETHTEITERSSFFSKCVGGKKTILLIIMGILLGLVLAGGIYYFFVREKNPDQKSTKETSSQEASEENKSDSSTSTASTTATDSTAQSTSQKTCTLSSRQANTPYYHQVYSASSTDGKTWTKLGKMLFDHSSVPGAVIKDGVIYLYFVDASEETDQLSVAISNNLGKTFTKSKVTNPQMSDCNMVDPHPELVDGKIRLYYLGNFSRIMEMEKQGETAFKIYSAQSSDGINFTNQQEAYASKEPNTDPDIFATENDWRMFVSNGKGLDLVTSQDGGVTFTKDKNFSWNEGGISDTFNYDGTYRTYYCGQGGGISTATGANIGKLTKEQSSVVDEQGKTTCDPSVIQLPDKTYLMFYKTQTANSQPAGGNQQSIPTQNSPAVGN